MTDWLKVVASEEMNSASAITLLQEAISTTLKHIDDPKTVLCVGCGDGTEIEMWQTIGVDVTGIDLNANSLDTCKYKGLKIKKMDAHKMSFRDNSFGLVFLRDVFEHALSPIKMIDEIARVTERYVVIVLPGQDWQDSPHHFIIPTLRQMISLAQKVGLQLKHYQERSLVIGNMPIEQNYYLFEKHEKH